MQHVVLSCCYAACAGILLWYDTIWGRKTTVKYAKISLKKVLLSAVSFFLMWVRNIALRLKFVPRKTFVSALTFPLYLHKNCDTPPPKCECAKQRQAVARIWLDISVDGVIAAKPDVVFPLKECRLNITEDFSRWTTCFFFYSRLTVSRVPLKTVAHSSTGAVANVV